MRQLVVFIAAPLLLGGCVNSRIGGLEREIAAIGERVAVHESSIDQATGTIAAREDGIYTQVAYRPIVRWADVFSSGPLENRTIRFQQTGRDGYIERQSRRCRVWPPYRRDGYYVRIDEARSTRAELLITRFAITPTTDGLSLTSGLKFDGRTQVGGEFEPGCVGGVVRGSIGVTATASPPAHFRLRFAPGEAGTVKYSLDLVQPDRIGLEMRGHVVGVRFGFTVPMEGLARNITSGSIDLMMDREGKLVLPDGRVVGYRLGTVNPRFSTSLWGVHFGTDVNVVIDAPVVVTEGGGSSSH